MAKKVVLAYSGGLDASVAVRWMIEEWGVDVHVRRRGRRADPDAGSATDAVLVDRALAAGAGSCTVVDARAEMAESFCGPAILANAKYEGKYPLVSALSRPVIVGPPGRCGPPDRCRRRRARLHGQGERPGPIRGRRGALAPDLEVLAPARVGG